eukprot:gene10688-22306_t
MAKNNRSYKGHAAEEDCNYVDELETNTGADINRASTMTEIPPEGDEKTIAEDGGNSRFVEIGVHLYVKVYKILRIWRIYWLKNTFPREVELRAQEEYKRCATKAEWTARLEESQRHHMRMIVTQLSTSERKRGGADLQVGTGLQKKDNRVGSYQITSDNRKCKYTKATTLGDINVSESCRFVSKSTQRWRENNADEWRVKRNADVLKWRHNHLEEARKAECLRHKKLYAFRKQFLIFCKTYEAFE